MESELTKPVRRLVEDGVCSEKDIREAIAYARDLGNDRMEKRISDMERRMNLLGDATRLRMLLLLTRREMCVCELEAALELSQSTASHHLGLLEGAGILGRSRRARRVFYRLNRDDTIGAVLTALRGSEKNE